MNASPSRSPMMISFDEVKDNVEIFLSACL